MPRRTTPITLTAAPTATPRYESIGVAVQASVPVLAALIAAGSNAKASPAQHPTPTAEPIQESA